MEIIKTVDVFDVLCQVLPWMPQKEFVATGIIVFDFELFIGERSDFLGNR